jgi:tetratricopeptide (TPR) repeat protein
MGQLYAMVGQHEEAIKQFQKSLDIEPEYPFALRGLASSYLALGKIAEARDALVKALQLEPDSAHGLFVLAKFDARMGDVDAAEQALRRCVKLGGNGFLTNAASDDDLKRLVPQLTPVGQ